MDDLNYPLLLSIECLILMMILGQATVTIVAIVT